MTSPQGPEARTLTSDATAPPAAPRAGHEPGPDWVRTAPAAVSPSDPEPPAQPAPEQPRPTAPAGPRWDDVPTAEATTVLPEGSVRRPAPGPRTTAPTGRPAVARPARTGGERGTRPAGKTRKARLALKRIDPWSVFVFSLLSTLFLGVALVVAVGVLYAVLSALGVPGSINELFSEVAGGDPDAPLLTGGRFLGGAAVLAAVNVVVLTLLATLGAVLYNLCASFTGGIELTLGERDG